MDISVEHSATRVVVVLEGELDASTAPELERAVLPVLADVSGDLVVDLARVDFVDSSGLRVLVRFREQLLPAGRSVLLRSPTPSVRRVFEITRLEEAFGL